MTFTIVTFGCKVNSYETEAVKEMMIKASFEYVKNYKDADIVLFNTCSVTRVSEKKCLTKIRSLNANYKDKIACCFGCLAVMPVTLYNILIYILIFTPNVWYH